MTKRAWGRRATALNALQFLENHLALARRYPRHLVLTAVVGGLLLGPHSHMLAVGAGLCIALLAGRLSLALVCCLAALAVGLAVDARLVSLDRTELQPLLGRTVTLDGELAERFRSRKDGSHAARVKIAAGRGRGEVVTAVAAPEVPLPQTSPGSVLTLTGKLRKLRPYESYQRVNNVHAVLEITVARDTGRRRGGLAGRIDRIRERAERVLTLGLRKEESALLRGMVLGQDEALSDPSREEFRRSGLAHLVAASGQNIMLLAALAFPVLAMLGFGLQARFAAVLVLIALYVPLAGAGPSIQRAGIMGAAGIFAGFVGRPGSRWYALLLSALVTLLINPRSSADIGWQLSFAAVIAIFLIVPGLHRALKGWGVPSVLSEALAVTVAATVGTAPLSAFHFEQLSLVSLPANLLAAPAVAPVMWLGAASATLGQALPSFAQLIGSVVSYPLAYIEWVAHTASLVPSAAASLRIPTPILLMLIYVLLLGVVLVARLLGAVRIKSFCTRPDIRRLLPVAPLLLVAGLVATGGTSAKHQPPKLPTVSFLDIGQGDATLIQDGEVAVLVDTGPPGGPLLARLKEAGVSRIDLLVLTHAQADHQGAAPAVLANYPVSALLDGSAGSPILSHRRIVDLAESKGVKRVLPSAGQVIRAGRIELKLLWPDESIDRTDQTVDPNDRAIVALLKIGSFDLLLTADAETNVTGSLPLPQVDALKVAHHGSDDPGLPDLLERTAPKVAVIEVGRHNPYGHPTRSTLGALERTVPHVYRTDRDGTVKLTVQQGGWQIKPDRAG